jgi:hypothetical protein
MKPSRFPGCYSVMLLFRQMIGKRYPRKNDCCRSGMVRQHQTSGAQLRTGEPRDSPMCTAPRSSMLSHRQE